MGAQVGTKAGPIWTVQISDAEGGLLHSDIWQVGAGENVRRYDLE